MFRITTMLVACASGLVLAGAWRESQAEDPRPREEAPAGRPGDRAPKRAVRPKGRGARPAAGAARRDDPPPCPRETPRPARPAPASMGDFFMRMGERFATNPSAAPGAMFEELAGLEGPALEQVEVGVREERQAGLDARKEYLDRARARGFRESADRDRLRYLEALVARMARRMKHRDRYPKLEVTLIDAPIADGQAFPGGFLAFTTGLLEEPDEATVAGVVAHELAHLDRGHMFDVVRRNKLAREAYRPDAFGGATFDAMFTRQAALLGMIFRPFRPEQESDADCAAAEWMYREGYDPEALVGFFERLHRRKGERAGPNPPFFAFAETHPYSLDRRDHVRARLRQLQRWRPRQDLGEFPGNLRRLEAGAGVVAGP